MPAWSDILSLSEDGQEDVEGMLRSVARIQNIVESEVQESGIRAENIVIGGFSQGGTIALQTYLRSDLNLGGCIGFSTWLSLRDTIFQAVPASRQDGRIALWHGDSDPIVNYNWGVRSFETLRKHLAPRFDIQFETVRGMGHGVNDREIASLRELLSSWVDH